MLDRAHARMHGNARTTLPAAAGMPAGAAATILLVATVALAQQPSMPPPDWSDGFD
eukprot:SAG31_NODE_24267_length_485_cov_1.111399_1_plen_55_part_10